MVLTSGWIGRLLRGEHLVLYFDKGGSPPAALPAPDPVAQIAAEAKVNRYNVRSPFGTQTWYAPGQAPSLPGAPRLPASGGSGGSASVFDQAGYDAALAAHQANRGINYIDEATGQPVYNENRAPAPTREQFMRQSSAPTTNALGVPITAAPSAPIPSYSNPDDAPWTQEITLDPSQQRQFDAKNAIAESMLGRARTQFDQFQSTPFTFDAPGGGARSALDRLGQRSTSFTQQAGTFNPNVRDLGAFNPDTYSNRAEFNPTINAPGTFNPNVKNIGEYTPTAWNLGNFNPNVRDLGAFNPGTLNLGAYNPNVDDATARTLVARLKGLSDSPWSSGVDGSRVSDAVYAKAKALLDPTYGRMQSDLDQKLVNQGLPIGSEAYGQANDVFGRERSNAYNEAALNAIIQGANEEQNQFGRALSTRQQNVADIAAGLSGAQSQATGEFGRYQTGRQQQQSEQGQQYGQALSTRGQLTAEQQADYARQLATRGQQVGEQGQQFSQGQAARQQMTAEQQADYLRQLETQRQREAGAQADYGRQASTRQIQSGDISDVFKRVLAARGQQTAEQQADFARQLATRGQQAGEFGDDFSRGLARDQGMFTGEMALDADAKQRALTQRQQQYNELSALLGGQQLQPLNPSGGAVNVASAFNNQMEGQKLNNQNQMAGYNAGVMSGNNILGGLFGLGKAALPFFL